MHVRPLLARSLFAFALCLTHAKAADWPQFLGPNRNGISDESGLIDAWPEDGLPELWRVPGGVGMSAVSVAKGTAYTLVQAAEHQYLLALDAKTGEQRWRTPVAPAYKNQQGDGPRATPTVADQSVYVFTGEGILAALSAEHGKVLWSVDVPRELGGRAAEYGMSASPLVVGSRVVVHAGTRQAAVAAFATADGKLQWKAGSGAAGYASPTIVKLGGRVQIVSFTGAKAYGLDATTGDVLWDLPYETDYDCNTATPIRVDDHLLLSAGENHGSVMLAVTGGDVSEVWSSLGRRSTLRNEWQTSIHADGFLYGFDNVGSAGPVTHLTCVKAANGERVWQEPRFGKGNLIAADGKLFMVSTKGNLIVARIDSKGYDELGRQAVCEFTRQAPSLANGRLYLRDDQEIICIDVSGKSR